MKGGWVCQLSVKMKYRTFQCPICPKCPIRSTFDNIINICSSLYLSFSPPLSELKSIFSWSGPVRNEAVYRKRHMVDSSRKPPVRLLTKYFLSIYLFFLSCQSLNYVTEFKKKHDFHESLARDDIWLK